MRHVADRPGLTAAQVPGPGSSDASFPRGQAPPRRSRHSAEAPERSGCIKEAAAIRLTIHWTVMTIRPDRCALKCAGPSVIVMYGMPTQPYQQFDRDRM